MNKNKLIKKGFIALYKMLLYVVLLGVFIAVFGRKYEGLNYITRTLVITCSSFSLVMFLMINVYGNFEIGEKKSKPVLFSTFMNIFVTDIVALVALKVMAVHERLPLSGDLLVLLLIILLQYIAIYLFTYFGNYFYFKLFNPIRAIIIHNNSEDYPKLIQFFNRHKKQFEILGVYNQKDSLGINFDHVQQIYLLDLEFAELLSTCTDNFMGDIDVFYNASLSSVLGGSNKKTVIDDILIYEFSGTKMSIYQSFVKRVIDIIVSIVAIICFSPIFVIVGIAIKLDDRGPIFYRQERVTKNGEIFKIVKFRSMKLNSGNRPATKNDDRITKVGHVIRKFRLDEIPQFINILNGDMSVVGPRPESKALNDEITSELPEFRYRLKVKAGLTGYAQIFGKYNTSPSKKLILDLEYIENYSILQDIKLLFQTLIVFVKKDSTEGFDDSDENSLR